MNGHAGLSDDAPRDLELRDGPAEPQKVPGNYLQIDVHHQQFVDFLSVVDGGKLVLPSVVVRETPELGSIEGGS